MVTTVYTAAGSAIKRARTETHDCWNSIDGTVFSADQCNTLRVHLRSFLAAHPTQAPGRRVPRLSQPRHTYVFSRYAPSQLEQLGQRARFDPRQAAHWQVAESLHSVMNYAMTHL